MVLYVYRELATGVWFCEMIMYTLALLLIKVGITTPISSHILVKHMWHVSARYMGNCPTTYAIGRYNHYIFFNYCNIRKIFVRVTLAIYGIGHYRGHLCLICCLNWLAYQSLRNKFLWKIRKSTWFFKSQIVGVFFG